MITFITDRDPNVTAKLLDSKRLGKQRIEALQILNSLVGISKPSNHPAFKMWKGYEEYLLYSYIPAIMNEWKRRGYSNTLCDIRVEELKKMVPMPGELEQPEWFGEKVFVTHKSRLIQKNKEYYKPLFPDVPENLAYYWPIGRKEE